MNWRRLNEHTEKIHDLRYVGEMGKRKCFIWKNTATQRLEEAIIRWESVSEIVSGMVLLERLDPNAVNPQDLHPPYGEIIPLCRDGKSRPEILDAIGFTPWDTAVNAAKKVNGEVSPLEWVKILEKTASKAMGASALERVVKAWGRGEEVDIGQALQAINMVDSNYRDLTPMSDVDPQKAKWVRTGYHPIDEFIGGLPDSSLTIVGASPGVGKTTFALRVARSMIQKHPKKSVAIFTLEMTMAQITSRVLELDDELTMEERSRILMSENSYSVHEVYAIASRAAAHDKLSLIVIDFADLMVKGEQSEATMGVIYINLTALAKKTGVPVLLVSQLNRETYRGGIPKINHLRYSGLAEATAALIILIYNPHTIVADYSADTTVLPTVPGCGYLIVGKSRFGFRKGGPGGIQVEWDGLAGWGEKGNGYFKIIT